MNVVLRGNNFLRQFIKRSLICVELANT